MNFYIDINIKSKIEEFKCIIQDSFANPTLCGILSFVGSQSNASCDSGRICVYIYGTSSVSV